MFKWYLSIRTNKCQRVLGQDRYLQTTVQVMNVESKSWWNLMNIFTFQPLDNGRLSSIVQAPNHQEIYGQSLYIEQDYLQYQNTNFVIFLFQFSKDCLQTHCHEILFFSKHFLKNAGFEEGFFPDCEKKQNEFIWVKIRQKMIVSLVEHRFVVLNWSDYITVQMAMVEKY